MNIAPSVADELLRRRRRRRRPNAHGRAYNFKLQLGGDSRGNRCRDDSTRARLPVLQGHRAQQRSTIYGFGARAADAA